MKIYLATTAPGNETWRERGMLDIPRRLLSYYHIIQRQFGVDLVFQTIASEKANNDENIFSRWDANHIDKG